MIGSPVAMIRGSDLKMYTWESWTRLHHRRNTDSVTSVAWQADGTV